MKRMGVDVGGTFTDFIYVDDAGKVEVYKTSTTPADPSIGMMEGINAICDKLHLDHGEIDEIFHGTTIATNMVLEHKGARAGMITTKGTAISSISRVISGRRISPSWRISPGRNTRSVSAATAMVSRNA